MIQSHSKKEKSIFNTTQSKTERYILIALILSITFTIIELFGGWYFGSLALISDAAHMFTDVASLIIAFLAIQIGKRVADLKRTYGYYRFEILAAALNAIILFLVAIYIIIEAYHRLSIPKSVDPKGMLIIGSLGFLVNFISISLLHKGSKESLNVRGAYLEAWADLLSSIGVVVAAIIIYFTNWKIIDSIVAIGIGIWVLPRSYALLKESINILLEGVPEGFDLTNIQNALETIENVSNVHDLHVWALTSGNVNLTVHFVVDPRTNMQNLLNNAKEILKNQFRITHSTIQIEYEHCGHDDLPRTIERVDT